MTYTRKTIAVVLIAILLLPTFLVAQKAQAAPPAPRIISASSNGYNIYVTIGNPASYTSGSVTYNIYANERLVSTNANARIVLTNMAYGSYRIYAKAVVGGQESAVSNLVVVSHTANNYNNNSNNNWYAGGGYNWYDYYNFVGSALTALYGPGSNSVQATGTANSYYGSGTVSYTIALHSNKLTRVGVDRQSLTEGTHYNVAATGTGANSKTVVTFTESFLNSLSLGVHEFSFSFGDLNASARLDIAKRDSSKAGATIPTSPGTSGSTAAEGNAEAQKSGTVYSAASKKSSKLGTISKGASIELLGFSSGGTYAKIQFGNQTGYVDANCIYAEVEGYTGHVANDAKLYTEKSTNKKYVYAEVSSGTSLVVLARDGAYWKVNFNDDILYIRASDLVLD